MLEVLRLHTLDRLELVGLLNGGLKEVLDGVLLQFGEEEQDFQGYNFKGFYGVLEDGVPLHYELEWELFLPKAGLLL